MEHPKRTRQCDRTRPPLESRPQPNRQICLPMSREDYDAMWHETRTVRKWVEQMNEQFPELFPEGFEKGFSFTGFLPESRKMPGLRLRQIRLRDESRWTLRPSFVMRHMTGTAGELEYPLLLLSYGVPCWLITKGFGKNDMFWHRHLERLGRNALVGTTVFDPEHLPEHLAADEHHADWQGKKGYVATTAAKGCVLGVALTAEADQTHLEEAYGVFAQEARDLSPEYAPKTVNTDGWWATGNAFCALFPTIVTILCFLHGFLKVRDRCRKEHDLHTRIWKVYQATNQRMFDRRMQSFRKWFLGQSWSEVVTEMVSKLWKRARQYRLAYKHPACYRTSNQVDRPMNRMTRLLYAGRGLHGNLTASERRLRGWALLHNFREYAPRSGQTRAHQSPAHQINNRYYHENWLQNLMISTSLGGQKSTPRKC
jgi:hypothetical protein